MDFISTPEEAQATATNVAHYLAQNGFTVDVEAPIDQDAPYRTTLLAHKKQRTTVLVEALGHPNFSPPIQELARWLDSKREYAELYLAVSKDATMSAAFLSQVKREGIGLFIVDSANVEEYQVATNRALIVTCDPTLPLRKCKSEVQRAFATFNKGERKSGLREVCEIVEREINKLGLKASRKGWINKTEAQWNALRFSDHINILGAPDVYVGGRPVLLAVDLKNDLHSFRGARNLVDHPSMNRWEDRKRERQYGERMLTGARLIAELLTVQQRVR